MSTALHILLALFCFDGLRKCAMGFLVPYRIRIKQIASYYEKDSKVIGVYDTAMLVVIAAIAVLLFATSMQYVSFAGGLVIGMLSIQLFYHRFNRVLPPEQTPSPPVTPNKLNSFAVQAQPALAWREVLFMTALLL
jgi:hypothetical protein